MTRHSPPADTAPAFIEDPAAPAASDRTRTSPQSSDMPLPAMVKSFAQLAAERPGPVSTIPPKTRPQSPLVISCPHAGRIYPAEFVTDSAVDLAALRGLEDFATDRLVAGLAERGHATVITQIARAFLDVNRAADALDPNMFSAPPHPQTAPPSRLVRAGYGVIPRLTACRRPIHRRLLSAEDAHRRMALAYTPYHQAIADALARAQALHGASLLIDVHSMPPLDGGNRPLADIVLGDVHHRSLDRMIREKLAAFIAAAGFTLAWNSPYAGGFITKHYGEANGNRQSVQIEINRRLYMCDGSGRDGPRLDAAGAARVRGLLGGITAMLTDEICAG